MAEKEFEVETETKFDLIKNSIDEYLSYSQYAELIDWMAKELSERVEELTASAREEY